MPGGRRRPNRINWGRFWNREKSFKRSAKVDKVAPIVFKIKPMASTWKACCDSVQVLVWMATTFGEHSFQNVHSYFANKHSFYLVDFMNFVLVIHWSQCCTTYNAVPNPWMMVQKRISDSKDNSRSARSRMHSSISSARADHAISPAIQRDF